MVTVSRFRINLQDEISVTHKPIIYIFLTPSIYTLNEIRNSQYS